MLKLNQTFKRGATSIYVVVISTLLFSVITVSFIRIVISETSRTTSDELAQSAYDSALAGVEDAKTALKKYYDCIAAENTDTVCANITSNIEEGFRTANLNPGDDGYDNCDSVAHALGRIQSTEAKEVIIQEKNTSQNPDNIIQAYTCIKIDDSLADYRSTLSSSNTVRVIPLRTDDVTAVTGVKISWYTEDDGVSFTSGGLNYANQNSFVKLSGVPPTPPTISAQIIQTATSYTIDDFDTSSGSETNRGTVILVPTRQGTAGAKNHITSDVLVLSNNHSYSERAANDPQIINCTEDEFACSTTVAIPDPKGGVASRNADTFFLILTLPYGQPTTTFSVQLCKDNDSVPGDCRQGSDDAIADFKGVQISVDSTGRANDMYSRVEARLEFSDPFFPYPEFAIQATGSDEDSIKKNFYVTDNCFRTNPDGTTSPCDNTGETN